MRNIMNKIRANRFENHLVTYAILYFLLLAPPRAFQIKINERANGGELAKFPTFFIVAIELIVRVAIVLIFAAGVEAVGGNTFYETYRLDVFFVSLVVVGTLHSATFYLTFNGKPLDKISHHALFAYRLVRNSGYAQLLGFVSIVPVLVWHWDREIAPYADGEAMKIYFLTTCAFLVLGAIEAKVINRIPLGSETKQAAVPVGSAQSQ